MKSILSLLLAVALLAGMRAPSAQARESLEIGYMPILPVAQVFVMLERGWMDAAGIAPRMVGFQSGPAMVDALLEGRLDAVYLGVGPVMVARARGVNLKIVAAAGMNQIVAVARGNLAPYFDSDPETAIARFTADHGRRPVISTFPAGSVPDTVMQYWLRRQLGVDPAAVEIVHQGAAAAQAALLAGRADGAVLLEPVVGAVLAADAQARIVSRGSALFPEQPGAVLAVRETVLRSHATAVEKLVRAHVRATRLLREEPQATVPLVAKYVGGGRLDRTVIEAAMRRSADSFIADPRAIVDGSERLQAFQQEIGTLRRWVDFAQLFDMSVYDRVVPR